MLPTRMYLLWTELHFDLSGHFWSLASLGSGLPSDTACDDQMPLRTESQVCFPFYVTIRTLVARRRKSRSDITMQATFRSLLWPRGKITSVRNHLATVTMHCRGDPRGPSSPLKAYYEKDIYPTRVKEQRIRPEATSITDRT